MSGSRGTRTHKRAGTPAVFETASSSGRMTSFASCGSWNRTNDLLVQSQALHTNGNNPAIVLFQGHLGRAPVHGKLRRQESNLRTPDSKAGAATNSDNTAVTASRKNQNALRELNPPRHAWKPGAFAARPRAQFANKLRRQESNLRQERLTAAFPYQHGTHRKRSQDGWIRTSDLVRPRHADCPAFPHPESTKRPVGVEPTHPPWQGSRLPLHHGRVSNE